MIVHGRQNIEWLSIGGKQMYFLSRGRYNLSPSPYSAQATAALKAQFPTQWPTIAEYGFAHPALAPFINEDPMMVMSLIEGLGKRATYNGNTSACVDIGPLNQYAAPAVEIEFYYTNTGSTYNGVFGSWSGSTINTGIWINDGYIHSRWGKVNGTTYNNAPCPPSGNAQTLHTIVANMSYFKYDNTILYNSGINRITYTGNNKAPGESGKYIGYTRLITRDGDIIKKYLVPFICQARTADKVSTGVAQAAGTCGMIDLLTGIFYPNANSSGSFTISETPAS